jgi:death-on-curing protein
VRFLTLAEALVIAEAVTGISARTLQSAARIELLDSALHAPQAGFGDEDFHPSLSEKAAVLCVRLARNHPLPDGNKRLAWTSTVTFLAINGIELTADPDDAVEFMLGVAAGTIDEQQCTEWIATNSAKRDS